MLITAAENAPRSLATARIVGRAQIEGAPVSHPCRLASMAWPVRDWWQETPCPRLLADVPVSVSGFESTPISIVPAENKPWEATAGGKLTIPLNLVWRGEFSGRLRLRAFGAGFEGAKEIDVPAGCFDRRGRARSGRLEDTAWRIRDRAVRAVYGEIPLQSGGRDGCRRSSEKGRPGSPGHALLRPSGWPTRQTPPPPTRKPQADEAAKAAAHKQQLADAAKVAAAGRLKAATDAAVPKDTVDIVVSQPIRILIKPADGQ